jgi:6-phosphogluconolactonase/glucosamine-6-phosphate isomerase/deaminase
MKNPLGGGKRRALLQTVRMTMTYPLINHAKHVWFLSPAKKKAAFEKAQADQPKTAPPASYRRNQAN